MRTIRNFIRLFIIFTITSCIASLSSCKAGSEEKKEKDNAKESSSFRMVMPQVPSLISDSQDRFLYVARHLWDSFPFADTTVLHPRDQALMGLQEFVQLLQNIPVPDAQTIIKDFLHRSSTTAADSLSRKAMRQFFHEGFAALVYDPNSPVRNEDLYIPYLEYCIEADEFTAEEKEQAAFSLKTVMLNRPGQPAGDFYYSAAITNKSGTAFDDHQQRMYDINAPWLVIMFMNPYCQACGEIIDHLRRTPYIDEAINRRLLKILALYPDEDIEQWNTYLPNMPPNWINAYNPGQTIKNQRIYDLRAIPCLYLLDKNKTVLLKDVTVQALVYYLQQELPL